ncbi:hypothetical protein NKI89_26615 [Mesorhizobium sp. M0309]|uniref:hypothetical protein n=1 Tax=Mesorhizobium sp. M0309 TaxID=2956933 RepID=UPI00333604A3
MTRKAPWQRRTNENTKGLLRHYFLKGTDLSIHGTDEIIDGSSPQFRRLDVRFVVTKLDLTGAK